MPTIHITRELGRIFRLLQKDCAISRDGDIYCLCPGNPQDKFDIAEETAKALIKNKLVRPYHWRMEGWRWWTSWYGNRVWVLSDVGKEFKLPPEETWLED